MNPTFHPFGDRALLINFPQEIDEEINQQVILLSQKIEDQHWPEIETLIPAYCSLTVCFHFRKTTYAKMKEKIADLISQIETESVTSFNRIVKVPVCYGGRYGPDLEEISQQKELSESEIIRLHTGQDFRVYMLGFLPGFAYMGKLPEALQVSRKQTPRLKVAAGSVGLAGFQTGIYPSEAPGGWQIIGRTPLELFSPEKETPFLFQPGDLVRFYAIGEADFEDWKAE